MPMLEPMVEKRYIYRDGTYVKRMLACSALGKTSQISKQDIIIRVQESNRSLYHHLYAALTAQQAVPHYRHQLLPHRVAQAVDAEFLQNILWVAFCSLVPEIYIFASFVTMAAASQAS